MADILSGNAWVMGDHVNTDVIIPAKYLVSTDPAFLSKHCFEGVDPELALKIRPGDIVVGGENFGCGSSREHAPIAIKGLGVSCVIARSFGQIFYRNSFNQGLLLLEADFRPEDIRAGDHLSVDSNTGRIENRTTGKAIPASPVPPFMREIISAGGLIPYVLSQSR